MWQRNLLKLIFFILVIIGILFLQSLYKVDHLPSTHNNSSQIDFNIKGGTFHSPGRGLALQKDESSSFHKLFGFALQISYTADGIDGYLKAIDEIADTGANVISLSTAGYQENASSSSIVLDLRKSPTPQQFRILIKRAKSRGLKVILMPVILLSNPRGSEWRGVINPPSWEDWFVSYLAFIKYFAKIAMENDVYGLIVGAELVSTESFRDRWLKIIDEVRKIYHGRLIYSANWDHYKQVSFWDKVDIIGVTSYHTLSDHENPSVAELIDAWQPIKEELLNWQRSIGKPILFTEVGWCSQSGCSIEPWNYYRYAHSSQEGLEEQKNCYEAFIKVWDGTPQLLGVIFWEWTLSEGGISDFGYTPKNKPAMKVIRNWFSALRHHKKD